MAKIYGNTTTTPIKPDLLGGGNVTVDQTYSPTSENAQSGKAVAEALAPKEYELINTITITPDTDGSLPQYVTFTADKDGKLFELESFYVNICAGFTDGTASKLYLNVNNASVIGNAAVSLSNSLGKLRVTYRQSADRFIDVEVQNYPNVSTSPNYWSSQTHNKSGVIISPQDMETYRTVTNVQLYTLLGTNKTWINGSTFELWGVRK